MSPHNRRRRYLFVILMMVAFAAVLYFLGCQTSGHPEKPKPNVSQNTIQKEPVKQDFEDASFEDSGKWYGLCKKNSVHSVDDFRKTVAEDPVLKAHFANFNWGNVQMGKLEKKTPAYVHYRKNDTIFRKKTPITLPAGDGYITDGTTTVRTMCCNSYSAAPPAYGGPELEAEPSAGPQPLNVNNYSAPPEPVEEIITQEKPTEKPLVSSNRIVTPLIITPDHPGNDDRPSTHDHPDEPEKPTPPKPVPINAAIWLFGTGVAALIGLRRRDKK